MDIHTTKAWDLKKFWRQNKAIGSNNDKVGFFQAYEIYGSSVNVFELVNR